MGSLISLDSNGKVMMDTPESATPNGSGILHSPSDVHIPNPRDGFFGYSEEKTRQQVGKSKDCYMDPSTAIITDRRENMGSS